MKKSPKSPPAASVPRRAFRPFSVAALGLLLIAAHLVFFTWHTDRAAQTFNRATVPADTIAGIPEPRFFLENDSYAWLALVRDMMNAGDWRMRYTFMDNAPHGRNVDWSHLLIWTLRGMTTGVMAATGWPVARALELAGVWAMPLFQFLFLSLAFVAVFRKMGLLPAAGLVFVCLTFECISISFFPLKPDHHGFQFFFVLAAFTCLQFGGLGWIRTATAPAEPAPAYFKFPAIPELPEARRWFIASGIFGGLALWVGATVWLISLAIIALAMVPALPLFHAPQKNESYAPALWRRWAAAGCIVGLVCYLLEYAPRHFAMRLEVNHPLYWVSWLGVALGLEQLARLRRPLGLNRAWTARLLLAALVALALPLAVWFGPDSWHHLRDPFMKRLHATFITEFLPSALVRDGDWATFLATFRCYVLALPWVGGLLLFRRIRTPHLHRLFSSALLLSGLFLGIALLQQRWSYCLAAAAVWLTLLLLAWLFAPDEHARASGARWLGGLLLALVLLDGLYSDFARLRLENGISTATAIPPDWIEYNLKKRNALQWGLAAGTNAWRFAGMAPQAPLLYYYSGIPSVASYYWENAAGWQAEATLLADGSPDAGQAKAIARERGLTHIVTVKRSSFPALYDYVATGIDNPAYSAHHTLDGWLTYPSPSNRPSWIAIDEPLTKIGQTDYLFKTPAGLAKEKLQYQVYSIRPDASPAP